MFRSKLEEPFYNQGQPYVHHSAIYIELRPTSCTIRVILFGGTRLIFFSGFVKAARTIYADTSRSSKRARGSFAFSHGCHVWVRVTSFLYKTRGFRFESGADAADFQMV